MSFFLFFSRLRNLNQLVILLLLLLFRKLLQFVSKICFWSIKVIVYEVFFQGLSINLNYWWISRFISWPKLLFTDYAYIYLQFALSTRRNSYLCPLSSFNRKKPVNTLSQIWNLYKKNNENKKNKNYKNFRKL